MRDFARPAFFFASPRHFDFLINCKTNVRLFTFFKCKSETVTCKRRQNCQQSINAIIFLAVTKVWSFVFDLLIDTLPITTCLELVKKAAGFELSGSVHAHIGAKLKKSSSRLRKLKYESRKYPINCYIY